MSIFHTIHHYLQQQKYAINATLLGDDASLAWTNLGYWHQTAHYPMACRQMADHLAQAIALGTSDHLIDLGCGRGASLLHWQQHYQVQQLTAVEWQDECVQQIRLQLPDVSMQQGSFLHLKALFPQQRFDVALCMDAAYHSALNVFLNSVRAILKTDARFAFHYLILSEHWHDVSAIKKKQYGYMLKAADVNIQNLLSEQESRQQIEQAGFAQVQIEDLTTQVLGGFAAYIQSSSDQIRSLDAFKIQMTAKLCQKLYQDGLIRYVQIVAQAT